MKNLNISKLGVVLMTGVTLSAYATPNQPIIHDEVATAYGAPSQKLAAIELGNSWLSDSAVKPQFLEAFTQELTKSVQLKTEAQIEKVPAVKEQEVNRPNLSETKFASEFLGSVRSFLAPVVNFFSSLWNSIVLAV